MFPPLLYGETKKGCRKVAKVVLCDAGGRSLFAIGSVDQALHFRVLLAVSPLDAVFLPHKKRFARVLSVSSPFSLSFSLALFLPV